MQTVSNEKICMKCQILFSEKTKKNVINLLSACLCWGFTAQSTQWGHVERGQFT